MAGSLVAGGLTASFGHPDVRPDAVRVGGEAVAEVGEVVELCARGQILADHEPSAVVVNDLAIPHGWVGGGEMDADLQPVPKIFRADRTRHLLGMVAKRHLTTWWWRDAVGVGRLGAEDDGLRRLLRGCLGVDLSSLADPAGDEQSARQDEYDELGSHSGSFRRELCWCRLYIIIYKMSISFIKVFMFKVLTK